MTAAQDKTIVHGVTLQLDDEYLSPKMREVLINGQYENHEAEIITSELRQDDIYLELGAGIGVTSILAASKLKTPPVVFEANPILCKYLKINSRLNGAVLAVVNGVIASGEKRDFHIHENFWSSSLDMKEGVTKTVSITAYEMQTVLDTYKPTFLLCDIEGGEVEAFAKTDLSCLRSICLETHNHYVGDEATEQTIRNILKQGFAIDRLRSKGKVFLFNRI